MRGIVISIKRINVLDCVCCQVYNTLVPHNAFLSGFADGWLETKSNGAKVFQLIHGITLITIQIGIVWSIVWKMFYTYINAKWYKLLIMLYMWPSDIYNTNCKKISKPKTK